MKKYLAPFLIVLAVVLLPASSAGHAVGLGFVDLPTSLETGITAVVLFIVSWLFVQLITLIPWLKFLDPYKVQVAQAVSAWLITLIEQATPDAFGGVVQAGIVFILAVLAIFGIGEKLAAQNAPGFQSRLK